MLGPELATHDHQHHREGVALSPHLLRATQVRLAWRCSQQRGVLAGPAQEAPAAGRGDPERKMRNAKEKKNKYMCLSGMMEGPRLEAGEAGSRLGSAELLYWHLQTPSLAKQ